MILILCREKTFDVLTLDKELTSTLNVDVLSLMPNELSLEFMDQKKISLRHRGDLLEPELIIGWTSLHQKDNGNTLLSILRKNGYKVLNNDENLGLAQNKILNSSILRAYGIPNIRTFLVGNLTDAVRIASELSYPLVLKPLIGAKGEGIRKISSKEQLIDETEVIFSNNEMICMQECINKPERDIRVRVIGYKAEFAFYRFVGPDGFITNLSKGSHWEEAHLDETLRSLAEKAAIAFNAPIAGVDIVEDIDTGELKVIEVNATPAITWPYEKTVKTLVSYVETLLKEEN
ncbi:ATP-grasp domain-containing protein [Shouchella patagoniensis]|uniref:ATP-grasp domain-containing protein n=1 Tax=Shouchella patagoniensis TaxID=228576 RepID=UPI00099558E3|nr:RimK family alpha-L-glutamate ligase [Shouchella patagoniensis]